MIKESEASHDSAAREAQDLRLNRMFTTSAASLRLDSSPGGGDEAASSVHDITGMTGSFAYM